MEENMDQSIKAIEKLPELWSSFKNLFSLDNFRRVLIYGLYIAGTFYLLEVDYSKTIEAYLQKAITNFFILKFVGIGVAIGLIFYWLLPFFLRIIFHGWLRDHIINKRNEAIQTNNFSFKKQEVVKYEIAEHLISKWIIRLGYLTREEISENRDEFCNYLKSEQFLNIFLSDIYKWICVIIHLLVTTIVVWSTLNVWIIISVILILFFLSLTALGIIHIAQHPEMVERTILKLTDKKSK